jgi:hypothetical protein
VQVFVSLRIVQNDVGGRVRIERPRDRFIGRRFRAFGGAIRGEDVRATQDYRRKNHNDDQDYDPALKWVVHGLAASIELNTAFRKMSRETAS